MSSEPKESSSDVKQGESEESDTASQTMDSAASPGLTITLPEGSTSVSDAIVTNREMLREPQNHGIATDEDITHLSEAMESLSGKVDNVNRQYDESQSSVNELQHLVEQQQQQINELQTMVTSLADILGTEAEWNTFDEA